MERVHERSGMDQGTRGDGKGWLAHDAHHQSDPGADEFFEIEMILEQDAYENRYRR